jgi:hypothetical protein
MDLYSNTSTRLTGSIDLGSRLFGVLVLMQHEEGYHPNKTSIKPEALQIFVAANLTGDLMVSSRDHIIRRLVACLFYNADHSMHLPVQLLVPGSRSWRRLR